MWAVVFVFFFFYISQSKGAEVRAPDQTGIARFKNSRGTRVEHRWAERQLEGCRIPSSVRYGEAI